MKQAQTNAIMACGILFLLLAIPLNLNQSDRAYQGMGPKDAETNLRGNDDHTPMTLQTVEGTRQIFKAQNNDPSQDYIPIPADPGRRTRADGDLSFDLTGKTYADMTQDPDPVFFRLYADNQGNQDIVWGSKGIPITYTPAIRNDGAAAIDRYTVRLEVHEAIADPEGGWTIEGITATVNRTQDLGPLQAGETQDASLSWIPLFSGRFRILMSIEYGPDPDTSNNAWGEWPYILTDWNTVETAGEQEKWNPGAGWSVANKSHVDDEHTPTHFWECGTAGVEDLVYPFNTENFKENELPFWGYDSQPGEKGFFVMMWFSGGSAISSWDIQYWNSTSQAYDKPQNEAAPISDHWYTYGYGSMEQDGFSLLGTYLDSHYCSAQFKAKITGTNLYIDDLAILGLETMVPPSPEFSFDFKLRDGVPYADQWPKAGGNGIPDQTCDPGASCKWNFTLENTAPAGTADIGGTTYPYGATIGSVSFNVEAPQGWSISSPAAATRAGIPPGGFRHYELTVPIPDDAGAGNYSIRVTATASPEASTLPGQPGPSPPGPLGKSARVETVVNKVPDLELRTAQNESHTGLNELTGSYREAEYTIEVKNTANFASDITVAVESMPDTGSKSPWAIEIDGREGAELKDVASGETRTLAVKIEAPGDEKAGEYASIIGASLADYPSGVKTLELGTVIDQFFKLGDVTMTPREIVLDPANEKGRKETVRIHVSNAGNGEDQVHFEVKGESQMENGWIGQENGAAFTAGIAPVAVASGEESEIEIAVKIPDSELNETAYGHHGFTIYLMSSSADKNDPDDDEIKFKLEFNVMVERPDVQVYASGIATEPAVPVKGNPCLIRAKIYNNGTAWADNVEVRLIIDDALAGSAEIERIFKDRDETVEFAWVFEECGGFDMEIVVDYNNTVKEILETNNEARRNIWVAAPNLLIEDNVLIYEGKDIQPTPVPRDAGTGLFTAVEPELLTLKAWVRNDGDADCGKVSVSLNISYMDQGGETHYEPVDSIYIDSIKRSENASASFEWTPSHAGVTYTITIAADPESEIPERSENDNSRTESVEIKEHEPPEKGSGFELIFVALAVLIIVAVLYFLRRRFRRRE